MPVDIYTPDFLHFNQSDWFKVIDFIVTKFRIENKTIELVDKCRKQMNQCTHTPYRAQIVIYRRQ